MNLYRSVKKQESGTEVYIDGSKSSASRIDLNTLQFVPSEYGGGQIIVYNNEVHFFQATSTSPKHYKWNGSTWSQVSSLPYPVGMNRAVVYNNEIHLIGSTVNNYKNYHYKWNGSTWTSVATLPVDDAYGSAITFNNEIHIFFGSTVLTLDKHYKWNGSAWSQVNDNISSLNMFGYNNTVVYNNELHIFGEKQNEGTTYLHFKWNGTSWVQLSGQPSQVNPIVSLFVYNNEIHILSNNYHAKWNGTTWTDLPNTKFWHNYYRCDVINNKIIGFGNGQQSFAIEVIGSDYYYEE